MAENDDAKNQFNWRLPLYAASITIIVCVLEAFAESDGMLYFLLVFPTVSLLFIAFLLSAAIRGKNRRCLAILFMLAVYWILSFAFLRNYRAIRNAERWSLWSHRYKAEVLAQPDPASESLKHVEWDSWGFPGAGDTTVYLAFDPTDSLATAANSHRAGKFQGIPCTVPLVTRLESRWYAVLFYTDERWGNPRWDCGMRN